jgi:hypothetical protein
MVVHAWNPNYTGTWEVEVIPGQVNMYPIGKTKEKKKEVKL